MKKFDAEKIILTNLQGLKLLLSALPFSDVCAYSIMLEAFGGVFQTLCIYVKDIPKMCMKKFDVNARLVNVGR